VVYDDEHSPTDYCILDTSPEYRLSRFERLTLTGGAELEKAITWVVRQLSRLNPAPSLHDFSVKDALEASLYYTAPPFDETPDRFFVPPAAAGDVKQTSVHGLAEGKIIDLEFWSAYRPNNPAFASEYARFQDNQRVHVRYWKHDEKPLASMVAIHGWTMGDQRLNSLAFLPGVFYRLGMNVALIELPYHGRRQPGRDARNSDEEILFPSSHLVRTNECMGQVVSDLRQLACFLREDAGEEIGVIGMSLGGYIASLWASLDSLSFCVPVVPMVSMTDIAWEYLSRDPDFRNFKQQGLTQQLLDSIYRLHCPLTYSAKLPRDRMLIIAGSEDRIVPARQPLALQQHWGTPEIHWLDGGHLAHFERSRAFVRIVQFLRHIGLAHQSTGPRGLFAPSEEDI
jgi:pimeloyl-ACP methyl ester carboxylesterase